MSGDETNVDPSTFTAAGERIADILERAAIPVEPPVAVPGPSPADTAAANLAALMGIHIRAASAELAPRGPKIRQATQSAVAEIQAQDQLNAQRIRAVSPAEQLLTKEATGQGLNSAAPWTPGNPLGMSSAPAAGSASSPPGVPTPAAEGLSGSLALPAKTDWLLAAPAATGQAFADRIAKLTRTALAEGGEASPTLEKIFGEIKNPFTFMAEEVPTLGSRIGGPIGAVLTVPAILWDHQHGIPTGRAIVRGGAAFVAGTVVTGLVSGALGPELGIPLGIVAGSNASKFVDAHWAGIQEAGEAAVEFGKSAADGGFKAARLGR